LFDQHLDLGQDLEGPLIQTLLFGFTLPAAAD